MNDHKLVITTNKSKLIGTFHINSKTIKANQNINILWLKLWKWNNYTEMRID